MVLSPFGRHCVFGYPGGSRHSADPTKLLDILTMPAGSRHSASKMSLWRVPPKSPDLNPVEKFWGWLRRELLIRDLADLKARRAVLGPSAYKARVTAIMKSKKANEGGEVRRRFQAGVQGGRPEEGGAREVSRGAAGPSGGPAVGARCPGRARAAARARCSWQRRAWATCQLVRFDFRVGGAPPLTPRQTGARLERACNCGKRGAGEPTGQPMGQPSPRPPSDPCTNGQKSHRGIVHRFLQAWRLES